MKIITNGDFIFSLNFISYLKEHLYVWSYTSGSPNLDESIRLLVHTPNLVVFGILGSNLAVSYFYLASVWLVTFVSFYYFARYFLNVSRRSVCLVLAVLYTVNPIFLGNYSKLGLVLAATMLPLLLLFMKRFFLGSRFVYLVLIIFALNVSLIHPFTFAVNTLVLGTYTLYLCTSDRDFLKTNWVKFLIASGLFLLINAYIVLAVLGVGSISKSTLSQSISSQDLSSANLVEVANTGNLFTSLSLSKNIFLDFSFYTQGPSRTIYFFSVYLLLGLLIALLIYTKSRLKRSDQLRVVFLLLLFLCLALLATGTVWSISKLITLASHIPGGWAFRSPLKWQLYMPLLLASAFVIIISQLSTRLRRVTLASLLIITLLLNGYLMTSIHKKLLVPKDISSLSTLSSDISPQEKALLMQDELCTAYFRIDISPLNSLRATYGAKSAQLKEGETEAMDGVNLSNYDRLLSCRELPLPASFGFDSPTTHQLANIKLYSYKNPHPKNLVYATDPVLLPNELSNVAAKYNFVQSLGSVNVDFIEPQDNHGTNRSLEDVFESINPADITAGKIKKTIHLSSNGAGKTLLQLGQAQKNIFYQLDAAKKELHLSTTALSGFQNFSAPLDVTGLDGPLDIYFENPSYDFSNLLKNPSLEQGTWKDTVSDCFAYDNNPRIAMSRESADKTDGNYSLQLEAERHMACTGPDKIAVNETASYLMAFDYQTAAAAPARYNLSFDNPNIVSVAESLDPTDGSWQTYSRIIKPPPFSLFLELSVYGMPYAGAKTTTKYDNFKLIKIPNIADLLYIYKSPEGAAKTANVMYQYINPTKISTSVKDARGTTNIVLNDTYHKGWKLMAKNQKGFAALNPSKIPAAHYKINGQENGWLIDVDAVCQQTSQCTKNADGSYNLEFYIEFTPQRWFYGGLILSGATLASLGYIWVRKRRRGKVYSLRK